MNIIGIVYFYKSSVEELIQNIGTYIEEVDLLVIWLNSPMSFNSKNKISNSFPLNKIVFLGNGENRGLAFPTNQVIKQYNTEYNLLLTMDQDSKWINFSHYIHKVKQYSNEYNQLIFGPAIVTEFSSEENLGADTSIVDHVITSGAIYNMKLFDKIGYFREDFFIDALDEEICYRAKFYGINTYQINSTFLYQEFGETSRKNFIGKDVIYMSHSNTRIYFIVRNHIFLLKEYWNQLSLKQKKNIIKNYYIYQLIKIWIFDKEKINKTKTYIKGLWDGFFSTRLEK